MEATTCCAKWSGLEELEPVLRGWQGRRCRDESEVDDVVQETLLRAARYRGTLVDPERLRGWALRIASNVLRDLLRREARLPRTELADEDLDDLESPQPPPGEIQEEAQLALGSLVVGRRTALHHLLVVLRELRQDDRRLLRSFYSGGRSCARTSRECDIPPRLVKVRLFRARRRLTRALRRSLAVHAESDQPPLLLERR